jgi:hypothetical protein
MYCRSVEGGPEITHEAPHILKIFLGGLDTTHQGVPLNKNLLHFVDPTHADGTQIATLGIKFPPTDL